MKRIWRGRMEIETGGNEAVDSMRRVGRQAARGLALAALGLFTLTMVGCGGASGGGESSGGDGCAGAVGPGLFFAASDGASGVELWKTNGTDAGTVCVKNINPGAGSTPLGLTVFNGALYFLANDGSSGAELWKSDGTVAGTVRVKDINTGAGSSSPFGFTVFNGINDGASGALYFRADGGAATGIELWKTNGTDAGTVLVKDINTGAGSSAPVGFTVFNGTNDGANGALYFSASDGVELWKTDGTSNGTQLVKSWAVPSFPSSGFTVFHGANDGANGALYFRADDGVSGLELWKSDGTTAGTVLVKDINPGLATSFPLGFTVFNGALYFAANDGTSGVELWTTDGTVTGPMLVKDISLGGTDSNPSGFTAFNGALYFQADDGTAGIELWKTDGTEFGTVQVKDINPAGNSSPTQLTPF